MNDQLKNIEKETTRSKGVALPIQLNDWDYKSLQAQIWFSRSFILDINTNAFAP